MKKKNLDEWWAYRPPRVTKRSYWGTPWSKRKMGTDPLVDQVVQGRTDTDYFHFDCPDCGPNSLELDVELLGIRKDAPDSVRQPWVNQVVLGLTCRVCGVNGVIKIPCLVNEDFQLRDHLPERISDVPAEQWVYRRVGPQWGSESA